MWFSMPYLSALNAAVQVRHMDVVKMPTGYQCNDTATKLASRVGSLFKRVLEFHPNRKWTLKLSASHKFLIPRVHNMLRRVLKEAITVKYTAVISL